MKGGLRVKRPAPAWCHACRTRPMRANNMCARCNTAWFWNRDRTPRSYTRGHLVEEVRRLTGLSYDKSVEVVNAVLTAVRDGLSRGEEVRIDGFGTFGHNPKPAQWRPKVYFLPAGALTYMVNNPDWSFSNVDTRTRPED